MITRIFKDPIVQGEIDRSRVCLEHSRNGLVASRSMIESSREAIRASRALMQLLPTRSIQAVDTVAMADILAAMGDDEIAELIDHFADAYVEARKMGDEEVVAIIGKALKIVGRHLATTLGPKAAGVPLS